ncbi:MAG: hypothetical protein KAJ18_02570 [Candidatus Omnitrophica bacterium]|nr:hypothetical protein [Candidatus Omnitrophota bacterium]
MKITKSEEFKILLNYWAGRLNLKGPVKVTQDNRMEYPFAVVAAKGKNLWVKYNSRKLGKRVKCVWVQEMFHELGHIVKPLPYHTEKQQIINEWVAERFAIKMLKKHYPALYRSYALILKRNKTIEKLKKCDPLHYHAFKQVKEYQL